MNENIESKYVKDVIPPICGCPEISKLDQSTLDVGVQNTARQSSTSFCHQLCNY